jgi:WD40 repeat protein/tetratricopeptide (TPR) repeat protein
MTRWIRLAVLFLIGLATFSASIAQDDATPDATATSSRFDRMPPAATATAARPSAMRGQSAPSPGAISSESITVSNAHRVVELIQLEPGYVFDSAWIPGTHRLAVLTSSTLNIYDLDQPDKAPEEIPLAGVPSDIAISPDGRWLASNAFNNLTVIDLTTGEQVARVEANLALVAAMTFSPDGLWLAATNRSETIRLWSTKTFSERSALIGHTSFVTDIAFSTDSSILASSALDGTVRFWNVETGDEISDAVELNDAGLAVEFRPDGLQVAAADGNDILLLSPYLQPSPPLRPMTDTIRPIGNLSFNQDGTLLASGDYGNQVRLWDVLGGAEILVLPPHFDDVTFVAFTSDSALLASVDMSGIIRIWVVADAAGLPTPTPSYTPSNTPTLTPTLTPSFTPTSTPTLTPTLTSTPTLTNTPTITPTPVGAAQITTANVNSLAQIGEIHQPVIVDLDWIPGTHQFAAYGVNLFVYNADEPEAPPTEIELPFTGGLDVAISPDGQVALVADQSVLIIDMQTGSELAQLQGHTSTVNDLVFSPDGSLLATASTDKTIRIWQMSDYTEIFQLVGHSEDVLAVAFSSDGRQLVSTGYDGSVRIWDVTTGEATSTVGQHDNLGLTVAFHPNGELVASGGADQLVRLSRTSASGAPLPNSRLTGHVDGINSVGFNADGSLLVSGGWDDQVFLWDTMSGTEAYALPILPDRAAVVAFSPDGVYLAVLDNSNNVRLWATDGASNSPTSVPSLSPTVVASENLMVQADNSLLHNEFEAAIELYETALAQEPMNVAVYIGLGDAYQNRAYLTGNQDGYATAIAYYDQALELEPDNADVYVQRGNARRRSGNTAQGLVDYDAAFKINPDLAGIYVGRASHYLLSDNERTQFNIERALELDPEIAHAYYLRTLFSLQVDGDVQSALVSINRAIELAPNNPQYMMTRGAIRSQTGQDRPALDDFNHAIELYPDYAEAYYRRGFLLRTLGEYEQALTDFSHAIEIRPDYEQAYYQRGRTYYDMDNDQQAVEDLTVSITLCTMNCHISYHARGMAYFVLEDYEAAEADYREALSLNSEYAISYAGMGDIYYIAGQDSEALANYRRYLELVEDTPDQGVLDRTRELQDRLD